MSDTDARLSRLLDELASITDQIGFEAVCDAVGLWENAQADADESDWREVLGAGQDFGATITAAVARAIKGAA